MTSGLRVRWLVLTTLVVAGLGWAVLDAVVRSGQTVTRVPWQVAFTLGVLVAVVLVAGLQVRAYLRGRRPRMSGLRAARTLVLGQAAAITGAALAGWYLAHVLLVAGDLQIESQRDKALAAGAAALLAVALGVVGCLVERWCRIDTPHDDDPDGAAEPDGQPA